LRIMEHIFSGAGPAIVAVTALAGVALLVMGPSLKAHGFHFAGSAFGVFFLSMLAAFLFGAAMRLSDIICELSGYPTPTPREIEAHNRKLAEKEALEEKLDKIKHSRALQNAPSMTPQSRVPKF